MSHTFPPFDVLSKCQTKPADFSSFRTRGGVCPHGGPSRVFGQMRFVVLSPWMEDKGWVKACMKHLSDRGMAFVESRMLLQFVSCRRANEVQINVKAGPDSLGRRWKGKPTDLRTGGQRGGKGFPPCPKALPMKFWAAPDGLFSSIFMRRICKTALACA